MGRLNQIWKSLTAAVVCVCFAGGSVAADPLAGRYEPYADYYGKIGGNLTLAVYALQNQSKNATLSYFYTVYAQQQMTQVARQFLPEYIAGTMDGKTYQDALAQAATAAYYASQFAYQAYLETPNSVSQQASGYTYYMALTGYYATLSPLPPQDLVNDADRTLRLLSYRVQTQLAGEFLIFAQRDAELEKAALHHSNSQVTVGTTTLVEFIPPNTTLDSEGIVKNFSTFSPVAGSVRGAVGKVDNGVVFVNNNSAVASITGDTNQKFGLGFAGAPGSRYWTLYVAKAQ